MDTVKLKLNRANCLLAKLKALCWQVDSILLRTICYAIFESNLWYGYQLWGQTQTQILQNIEKIQNKAIKIMEILTTNLVTFKRKDGVKNEKEFHTFGFHWKIWFLGKVHEKPIYI